MSTLQETKQAVSSIDLRTAAKHWLRLLGAFGLVGVAMILYATAVVIVNELFVRWGVFEQGGETFIATMHFAFQTPLITAIGGALAHLATHLSGGRWSVSWRDGALYAARLALLAFCAHLYLLDFGVVAA
jgi:hypothetical protein